MKIEKKAMEKTADDFEKKVMENLFKTLESGVKASDVVAFSLSSDHQDMDSLFVPHSERIKIANLDDLFSFHRISSETLVHKSNKELWSIKKDGSGDVYIERHFNADSGEPLKV